MSETGCAVSEGKRFSYEDIEKLYIDKRSGLYFCYDVLMATINELTNLWSYNFITIFYKAHSEIKEDEKSVIELWVKFDQNNFLTIGHGTLYDGAREATDFMIAEITKMIYYAKKQRLQGKLPKGITLPKESS
jgi:hypothetical protein